MVILPQTGAASSVLVGVPVYMAANLDANTSGAKALETVQRGRACEPDAWLVDAIERTAGLLHCLGFSIHLEVELAG